MYCINCGVKLADSQKQCPLCATRVFHPDLTPGQGEPLYPQDKPPAVYPRSLWPQIVVTGLFLLSILLALVWDLQLSGTVSWSGFAIGGLLSSYIFFGLPSWFRKPNPVIFVPCSFAAVIVYLLYINLATGGSWFLSFAFPVAGGLGLIVTAVVTLLRYTRRAKLYILGGASILTGAFMLLVEFLLNHTFHITRFIGWSLYPLVTFVMLGGMLIFLRICQPARELMERKTFL